MERSKLGKSELLVSNISFGCMSLSKNDDHNTLIRSAYEGGINFFDTADRYDHGWNESILGSALKDFRDDVIISTKVGHQISGDGSQWVWKPTKDHIIAAADHSLKRLQTDRIDLYQLHGGTLEDSIDEITEAFEILQQAGKIRYYGISSIRPNVIRKYVQRSSIVSVMMQYSLADRRPEEECFELLMDNEIGVLARGTLAKGVLVNKPPADMPGYNESEVTKLQDELKKSGDPLSASLHFVLRNPAVTTVVVGIRTQNQLDEILEAYHTPPAVSKIDRIAKVLEPNLYDQHR